MEAIDLVCFKCKYFRLFTGEGGCDAFPQGIPDEIVSGENEHSKPLKYQENSLTFTPYNLGEIKIDN